MPALRIIAFAIAVASLDVANLPVSAKSLSLCTAEHMQKDPSSVEEPCTKVLAESRLDPKQRAEAFYIRGRGRHRSYRIPLAAQDYEEAIKLDPAKSEFYVDRANTKFRNDDTPGGLADLKTALQLDERNTRALVTLGIATKSDGQVAKGLEIIDQALRIDPDQPFGLLFRQAIYAELDRWPEAFRDADALVMQDPEKLNDFGYANENGDLLDFHIVALAARSSLHEQKGDLAKAEADLDAAVAYRPSLQSHMVRASFLSRQRDRDGDALKDWDAIASVLTDAPDVHYNRSLMLARLHRPLEAVEALGRTIELDDQDARAYELRGKLLRGLGRFDQAYADLTAAMTRDPSLIEEYIPDLWAAGYYKQGELPSEMTPALRDALKACSIDRMCRGR